MTKLILNDYYEIKQGNGGYFSKHYETVEDAEKAIEDSIKEQIGTEYEEYYKNMSYEIRRHINLMEIVKVIK